MLDYDKDYGEAIVERDCLNRDAEFTRTRGRLGKTERNEGVGIVSNQLENVNAFVVLCAASES